MAVKALVPALLAAAGASGASEERSLAWTRLGTAILLGGALYGLAMGSYEGRWLGACFGALKVPVLLTLSLAVCLPSFAISLFLLGLGADFPVAARAILAAQGTSAVVLGSLAPVTASLYLSRPSYPAALALNAGAFALAALCAQWTLASRYRPLVARRPRHRLALWSWLGLWAFVGIKLAWVLRPFVGDPRLAPTFLREGEWQEDPYSSLFWAVVALAVRLWRALGG